MPGAVHGAGSISEVLTTPKWRRHNIKMPHKLVCKSSYSSTFVLNRQIKHCLDMEPSQIFHTKPIHTEQGKCLWNSWAVVCHEIYLREVKMFPFSISSELKWELISDT